MLTMTDAIIYAMEMPGSIATAFVEFKTARAVAGFGDESVNFDSMTPLWTEMLLAQLAHADEYSGGESVNDMVISSGERFHLLRPLRAKNYSDLYFYLVVDQRLGTIPMARLRSSQMEERLIV